MLCAASFFSFSFYFFVDVLLCKQIHVNFTRNEIVEQSLTTWISICVLEQFSKQERKKKQQHNTKRSTSSQCDPYAWQGLEWNVRENPKHGYFAWRFFFLVFLHVWFSFSSSSSHILFVIMISYDLCFSFRFARANAFMSLIFIAHIVPYCSHIRENLRHRDCDMCIQNRLLVVVVFFSCADR